MCIKAVYVDPSFLGLISDHFKMQDVHDKAVKEDPSSLQYVPGWCNTREWMWLQYADYYDDDDGNHWDDDEDKFSEWYDGYEK